MKEWLKRSTAAFAGTLAAIAVAGLLLAPFAVEFFVNVLVPTFWLATDTMGKR